MFSFVVASLSCKAEAKEKKTSATRINRSDSSQPCFRVVDLHETTKAARPFFLIHSFTFEATTLNVPSKVHGQPSDPGLAAHRRAWIGWTQPRPGLPEASRQLSVSTSSRPQRALMVPKIRPSDSAHGCTGEHCTAALACRAAPRCRERLRSNRLTSRVLELAGRFNCCTAIYASEAEVFAARTTASKVSLVPSGCRLGVRVSQALLACVQCFPLI